MSVSGFIKRRCKELLPFLLSIVLSSAIFSVYRVPLLSGWTIALVIMTAAMFVLCEFVDKHHFIGGALFAIASLYMVRIFFRMIFYNFAGFEAWFLTGADKAETRPEYLIAMLVSFVPFFATVVFYFACVLYRTFFLTLISLIPCALYVKVLSEIDNIYIATIAMLNVAILMVNVRADSDKHRQTVGAQASVFSAGVFTFALLAISALIPKENNARYYDRFEQLFMNTGSNETMSDFSRFSDFSGGANSYRDFTNRFLYMLYGETVPYFKRQTFDYYDFTEHHWYPDIKYSEPYCTQNEWISLYSHMNLGDLQKAIKAADRLSAGFAEKYGLTGLTEFQDLEDPTKSVTVMPEDFGAIYYIAPARAVGIVPAGKAEQIYVTRGGVFRNLERPHNTGLSYQVWYYDEYAARFYWFQLGGANLSDERCGEMLTELTDILESSGDEELYNTAKVYLTVHNDAMEYKSDEYMANTAMVSERIHALAEEITAGMTYDWQKASALQDYFILNDYVYDLEYNAPSEETEYFLFESKRGSCSDYATAFVLMARSLGLTARYTEGFNPDITSREAVFAIRDNCSHAYPEVYIQNMGWIVFEPTVSSDYSQITVRDNNQVNFEIDFSLVYAICVISGVVLAVALTAVLLIPVISEKAFMRRLGKAEPCECAVLVYKRLSGKTAAKLIKRAECNTPYELVSSIEGLTGCDTGSFAYTAEDILYGGAKAGSEEKALICRSYECIRDSIKAYNKANNKKKGAPPLRQGTVNGTADGKDMDI